MMNRLSRLEILLFRFLYSFASLLLSLAKILLSLLNRARRAFLLPLRLPLRFPLFLRRAFSLRMAFLVSRILPLRCFERFLSLFLPRTLLVRLRSFLA